MNDQSTESLKDVPDGPRRRRLDAGQWRALIERQAGSDQSIAAFCDEHGVGVASFYSWRRRLNEDQARRVQRSRSDSTAGQRCGADRSTWTSWCAR